MSLPFWAYDYDPRYPRWPPLPPKNFSNSSKISPNGLAPPPAYLNIKSLKSSKPSKPSESSEWILSLSLLLLISSHSSSIINPLFSFISQCLISLINLSKLFLSPFTFINIGMEFFSLLKVCFLNIALGRISIDTERGIKIFFVQSLRLSESPCL
jgi:hypothetical protein